MKAVVIEQVNRDVEAAIQSLKVVERLKPSPGKGQVLVRMEAAPCNPSDLLFLQGKYGVKKTFPAVPGWEGAGTVVESGGGPIGWWLKGMRVACGGQSDYDGTWAEYYLADAKSCVPLQKNIPIEQGATLLINPLTAVGLLEAAKHGGHAALVQNAACSQVGKMVLALAKLEKIPVINIIRRQDQEDQLRLEGAEWVLNSEDLDFQEKFRSLSEELKATVAFDAVGGKMTGFLLNGMPEKSKIYVYGALSESPCGEMSPLSFIFQQKSVEGFWLSQWIKQGGMWKTGRAIRRVQQLLGSGGFHTLIRQQTGFEGWKNSLLDYHRHMTAGKMILLF